MSLFEFDNYKKYVNDRIQKMPKRGRGQYLKLSNFLAINSVNVSQIFKGDRELSLEQACELCEYFGFTELESEYFMVLVEYEKAGTQKLKKLLKKRIDEIKAKAQDLKHRLKQEAQLSEEARAIFYSSWYYSAIRLLTSLKKFNTQDEIAAYFGMPLSQVNRVLEFLTAYGLCVEEKGSYRIGASSTHLGANHPLVAKHHLNWRVKAISKLEDISDEELFLTLPASLSHQAMKEIRKELIATIERITGFIDQGPEEQVACLNIDFFKF